MPKLRLAFNVSEKRFKSIFKIRNFAARRDNFKLYDCSMKSGFRGKCLYELRTSCNTMLRMLTLGCERQNDKITRAFPNTYPASDAGSWALPRVSASPPGS